SSALGRGGRQKVDKKMSDTKVKVAVRVRPMNRREIELSTKCVVDMEDNQTVLHPPPSNAKGESRAPDGVRTSALSLFLLVNNGSTVAPSPTCLQPDLSCPSPPPSSWPSHTHMDHPPLRSLSDSLLRLHDSDTEEWGVTGE
ncbi:Kinesin-like protein KIF13A, partial [Takifugu flavidus]